MHPLKRFPPATLWHITQHFFDKEMPRAKIYLKSNSVDSGDYDIVERLIRAFDAMVKYESEAIPPEKRPNEGIWEMSKHEFHGKAYQLLFSKDVKGLASYLSNALRESVAHGLGPGPQVYLAMTNPQDSENVTYILIDRLLSLAEALGSGVL